MRINVLLQMLVAGSIGCVLFTAGVDFSTWQYWATIVLLVAHGVLNWLHGQSFRP